MAVHKDFNVLNPFKKNTIRIPRNLGSVTFYDPSLESDPVDAGLEADAAETIWRAVEDLYRTGTQPAITVSVRRHGRLILNRGIGYIRGGGPSDPPGSRKIPATPESPFCLFSASKAITAMAVHKLVEEGRLHLHDPIARYLPEYAAGGKGMATISHMLSHRAGIPAIPAEDASPELLYDWDAALAMLCAARPSTPAGHVQAYHALTGGYILGEIVQRVTAKSLRAYFSEIFQAPLGFRFFNYGVPEAHIGAVARNYLTGPPPPFPMSWLVERAIGAPFDQVVEVSNEPDFLRATIPSANIVASAEESCRFFQMLLNGGELDGVRVLAPETVRRAAESVAPRQFDRTLMLPVRYSLGMIRGEDPVGMYGPYTGMAYGHLGFINILCWADPRRELSAAILTNGKAGLTPHLYYLGRVLWQIAQQCPPIKGQG